MPTAGYQRLIDRFELVCIPPATPAEIRPVTRITRGPDHFHVPQHVAPAPDAAPIDQLLFAVRYEGLDLAVIDALAAAGAIADAEIVAAVAQQPNSLFGRRLGLPDRPPDRGLGRSPRAGPLRGKSGRSRSRRARPACSIGS